MEVAVVTEFGVLRDGVAAKLYALAKTSAFAFARLSTVVAHFGSAAGAGRASSIGTNRAVTTSGDFAGGGTIISVVGVAVVAGLTNEHIRFAVPAGFVALAVEAATITGDRVAILASLARGFVDVPETDRFLFGLRNDDYLQAEWAWHF